MERDIRVKVSKRNINEVILAEDVYGLATIETDPETGEKTLIVHENRPNSWTNWARSVNTTPPRPGKVLRFDSMAAVVQALHGVLQDE